MKKFLTFRKSFTFFLVGCLWAFCAANVFAQDERPDGVCSTESSPGILKLTPETEARENPETARDDQPARAQSQVQTNGNGGKIISVVEINLKNEKFESPDADWRRAVSGFNYRITPREERKKQFVFDYAASADAGRFSFRPSPAASLDDLNNPAAPDDAATAPNGKAQGFRWRSAIGQSLMFLAVQHGFALTTQPKTREALKGKFWKDYVASVKSLRRWDDGGRFFTNYIAHPMQGSLTGFIYVQNDPKALKQQFGASGDYWRSRLKAAAWSAAWSTQFEIGPVSQASIGNVGLKGKQTWGDIVITPTVGTAMLVSEDAVDRFVMKRIERATDNFYARIFTRMLLNPTRTIANLLRFREPWYRDRPPEH